MIVNHNGEILDSEAVTFGPNFRPIQYGDALFETMKFNGTQLVNWEDHYFRLMASMRILRMEIPMEWSPEYLEEQVREAIDANHWENQAARVRLTVYRDGQGAYTPQEAVQGFLIEVERWPDYEYVLNSDGLVVDVFKDHEVSTDSLSNLKTTNALLYTLAGIYARENELNEALLINGQKQIVESVSSNVFMVSQGKLVTPPLTSGALKGVMRKHIIRNAQAWGMEVEERTFSPFDLQRADEVWLTNSLRGIQWVKQYRKKEYGNALATAWVQKLNESIQ